MNLINHSLYEWLLNPEKILPLPTGTWILATGAWDDDGVWLDEESWNDGP